VATLCRLLRFEPAPLKPRYNHPLPDKILDVGCGVNKRPGSIGIDRNPASRADVLADLDRFPYPFRDSSFDRLLAIHVIEHVANVMATMEELRAAFHDIKNDAAIRVVIFTGAGEKAFIAGADIGELAKHDAVSGKEYTHRGQSVLNLIENLGKPVIACINGFALGGGCEIAMACTMRLASDNAKLGQPEVKLGIIPGYGGTQRLSRLIGKGLAMQMVLAGEMITAQEAHRIGLVNEVTAPADLIPRAEAIAAKIIANAPLAVQFAMEAVNKGIEMTLAEGLFLEAVLFSVACSSEDKKEGTTAFLEKRSPKWNS